MDPLKFVFVVQYNWLRDLGCVLLDPNGTWAWERWDGTGRRADCYLSWQDALDALVKDIQS